MAVHQLPRALKSARALLAVAGALALTACSGGGGGGGGAGGGSDATGAGRDSPGQGATDEAGTLACSSDFAVVSAATEVYYAVRGEWPSSQDDLLKEGIIRTASSRFTIGADGVILPAAFSGCTESTHGVASTTTAATITAAPRPAVDCIADKTAIEVALSAYTSKGQPSPATEAALVAAGYLVAESSAYDIGAGGAIVATTGGPCT